MKDVIQAIQDKIKVIPGIKYVDENWGQLDYYSSHPPVQFPCVLFDVLNASYSNIGRDRVAIPINRQMANFNLEIRVADVKLTNSSGNAPATQKNQARSVFELIELVHVALHGFVPTSKCGKLIRSAFSKVQRDDGVREFVLVYSGDLQDV